MKRRGVGLCVVAARVEAGPVPLDRSASTVASNGDLEPPWSDPDRFLPQVAQVAEMTRLASGWFVDH